MDTEQIAQRRQVVYWRLLTSMFGFSEQGANFEQMATEVVSELNLPQLILDPNISIENLLHRYPELEADFNNPIIPQDDTNEAETATLRRGLVFSKLLLNAFGPNTQTGVVTAQQYAQWLKDVGFLEKALGCQPGSLRGHGPGMGKNPGQQNQGQGSSQSGGMGAGLGTGGGFTVTEEQLRATLKALEGELIHRMALHEVLKDDRLASQLTPSMALVEQLLREKANLSGNALKNAKRLIQEYVDELAQVLRLQVAQAVAGKIDYSVPPKRIFRNLDLKRTIWKNLTNWNPQEQRLFVDRLYYHHTAKKKTPTRMIVVVDQSGSMVDAMVQCTILASIFAGLPNVDVHLLAFDTRVIDLTAWVHDPFEVLLRTQLGGGTHIYAALVEAAQKILEPQNTAMVLISDFYEGGSDQVLFDYIKSLKESGLHFIPVGAVTSSGYFSVNQWFRDKLKELGMPILTGSPKKLIQELKKVIVT
ncbi:VWA domain-containing protein [Calothrix sp. FACHB-1219]|uniref:VWA domain-containing protein n=1 Tax=unclassified Calothrix TaxID=2619626 RepID=UPI00168876F7|nr:MULTISPECIES: VWA domain-containing protein [unclassified Calothrix]MBD2203653.1 VWA domain-containing protein [Calothrix sp. FACHB-168]MBD2219959.1 VWA domain-containing protein [Calothrix sp. FACHB-1219]